jgi:putative hemolysin
MTVPRWENPLNDPDDSFWLRLGRDILASVIGVQKVQYFLASLSSGMKQSVFFAQFASLLSLEIKDENVDALSELDLSQGGIVVMNHPHGLLDLVASAHWFCRHFDHPIRYLGNRIIERVIPTLSPFLIPVDNMSAKGVDRRSFNRLAVAKAKSFVQAGGILFVFPAGEVSSLQFRTKEGYFCCTDHAWYTSFVGIAKATGVPIVPVHIGGRNPTWYLSIRLLGRVFGRMSNFRAFISTRSRRLSFQVFQPIKADVYMELSDSEIRDMVRSQVYEISSF